MTNKRQTTVIFTGLLEDTNCLTRSLDQLSAIEDIDQIIISTWQTEAAKNSRLLSDFANKYELIVVAVPEPETWSGNLLSQMVSLYAGLGRTKRENYVLKTRADVFIETDALMYALDEDLTITLPNNFHRFQSPFKEKIKVWGVEATVPFYIHDLFFYGRYEDISRLINMDIRYDVLYTMSKEKIHIRRFIHPFLYDFPIFEKFLHVGHVLGNTQEFPNNYRYHVLERLLNDDIYILILALYYIIVGCFFSNQWGTKKVFQWRDVPDQIEFRKGMTMSELLLGNKQFKALMLQDNDLFNGILERTYGPCPIGERFDIALDYLEGLNDIRHAGLKHDFDGFINRTIDIGQKEIKHLKHRLKTKRG